jgi:hypothetical protein
MSAKARVYLTGVLALLATSSLAFGLAPPPKPATPTYKVAGPHTHENLTIFFLCGEDQIKGKKLLTLDEALKDKKVIVHETKNVNELSIENVSADEVFVQAGDIVKGGQQDRTIAFDMIVPAKSDKLPISAFCVESGRWAQRGGENTEAFSGSSYALANKDLKLAARGARSQRLVWMQVQGAQDKLRMVLKSDVADSRSATSLQLTLEHKKLQESLAAYIKKLGPALDAKLADVIGFAIVINGKVVSADVYANADLFRRLWPKLVQTSAIEAVIEKKEGLKFAPVKPEVVTAFLNEVLSGKQTEKTLTKGLREVQQETTSNVLFETRGAEKDGYIRRSYLAK